MAVRRRWGMVYVHLSEQNQLGDDREKEEGDVGNILGRKPQEPMMD